MSPRLSRPPSLVVELLRLFVVVFFAAVGYELAQRVGPDAFVLQPFNTIGLGVIVGSGVGYALGGALGRTTVRTVARTELTLRETSAETILAGCFGAIVGVLVGAAAAWPVFLTGPVSLTVPLFGFVVFALGLLGYRVGVAKREAVLNVVGSRAGMSPRQPATASLPRVLDTSIAIDGRILDVVRAGFLHGLTYVPTPVLAELQGLADADDELRRGRGRRGLEVLEALRKESGVQLEVLDDNVPAVPEVDGKLVRICLDRQAALLTLDTNLAKAAALAGVRVMNVHTLALALRPPVSAGDEVTVLPIKPGKEPGQAVGYLDDGTMVVVERAREAVGREVVVAVTSVLTTANGRMVFGRLRPDANARPMTPRPAPPLGLRRSG